MVLLSWLEEVLVKGFDEVRNDPISLILLILLISIATYINVHIVASRKRLFSHLWPTMPGGLPIVGHWHKIRRVKNLTAKLEQWADQYAGKEGCYDIQIWGSTYTVICREDYAEYIIKNRVDSLSKVQQFQDSLNSVGGRGLMSAEGDLWRQERKLIAPLLHRKHHVQDYFFFIQDTAHRLVQKWSAQTSSKRSKSYVRITKDLTNVTIDVIARIALGKNSDLLNHPNDKLAKDIKALVAGVHSKGRALVDVWRLPFVEKTKLVSPSLRILKMIQSAVHEEEQEVRLKMQEEEENSKDEKQPATPRHANNFLRKLLRSIKSHNVPMEQERVLGNAMTLFLAGVPPTSKTLVRALYLAAKDPKLQRELRDEADAVHWESTVSVERMYESVPRLKSFLQEMHRFYGDSLSHYQVQEDLPFCGALLPKGTNLIVLGRYISTHRSAANENAIVGESGMAPSEFDPRRYLSKSDGNDSWICLTPRPSTFFGGFGHAARHCPGRSIAELFSYSVFVLLLQQFELELAPKHTEPREIYDVVQAIHCDVTLKLTKRTNTITKKLK